MTAPVPWDDPAGLLRWVEHNREEVTPLILERLLGHYDFVDAGTIPTTGKVRANVWKHRLTDVGPAFANFQALVYHYEKVPELKVRAALQLIEASRRAVQKLRSKP